MITSRPAAAVAGGDGDNDDDGSHPLFSLLSSKTGTHSGAADIGYSSHSARADRNSDRHPLTSSHNVTGERW